MEVGYRSINDIFNGQRIIQVPFFQRNYVWGESEWQKFLDNLENMNFNIDDYFFMGTIILKQVPIPLDGGTGDIRLIIDGQQRITTLILLFKFLPIFNPKEDKLKEWFKRTFYTINNNSLAFEHNKNDINAFIKLLAIDSEDVLDKLEELEKLEKNKKLNKDELEELYKIKKSNLYEFVVFLKNNKSRVKNLDLTKIINRIRFVVIDLSQNENEQLIFDTINTIGVKLTTSELLKNYLFDKNSLELYNKYWEDLFEKDKKDFWYREFKDGLTMIDKFFYAVLLITVNELSKNNDKLNIGEYTSVQNLFESYKKILKIIEKNDEKITFYNNLKRQSDLFFSTYNNYEEELEKSVMRIGALIFNLGFTTLMPYVLFVLQSDIDEKDKDKIFNIVETYIIRRIICKYQAKSYTSLFGNILIKDNYLNPDNLINFFKNQKNNENIYPNESEVENSVLNLKIQDAYARGVLYLLELRMRNKNGDKNVTNLKKFEDYTLEHSLPKKWQEKWSNLPYNYTEADRERKLYTLGNLTLLPQSLNLELRNGSWTEKLNGKGKKKGLKDLSSGLYIINDFLGKKDWNEKYIEKRGKFLAKKILEIWNFENISS